MDTPVQLLGHLDFVCLHCHVHVCATTPWHCPRRSRHSRKRSRPPHTPICLSPSLCCRRSCCERGIVQPLVTGLQLECEEPPSTGQHGQPRALPRPVLRAGLVGLPVHSPGHPTPRVPEDTWRMRCWEHWRRVCGGKGNGMHAVEHGKCAGGERQD